MTNPENLSNEYTGEKNLEFDPNTGAVEARDSRYPKDEEDRDGEESENNEDNEETMH